MGKDWIGLSWDVPKLPSLSLRKSRDSGSKPKEPDIGGLWYPKEQWINGFFAPLSDPRKLNQLLRKHAIDTAGTNWFNMPAPAVNAELKKDLQLLKLRTRKGIIRSETPNRRCCPKYFQVGTVIESSAEFYSSRLTKRERKATLADELLSDQTLRYYRKHKVPEIEEKNRPAGNDKWKVKGKQPTQRAAHNGNIASWS